MDTHHNRPRAALARTVAIAIGLAALGPTTARADTAPYERVATAWLSAGYQRKASGDLGGALQAFEAARRAGADPQRVSLEIAYAHLALGETAAARAEFAAASRGTDAELARRADQELSNLPSPWWADLYAESFGWSRRKGAADNSDVVPTVRLRGLRRLTAGLDLSVYAYAQATRDTASRGLGTGAPSVYADNTALAGAGLLLRLWRNRLGLFAQAGPALPLIDDGRDPVAFDARAGSFIALETAPCNAAHHPSPRCEELYSELIYTSRFDHDVQGFARARQSLRYLETGPVAWQAFWELRGALDRNGDYYDNFVDAGAGPRWRLRGPAPLDLLAGVHVGRYLGRDNLDPAPDPLDYMDLRVLAATYVEF